MSSLRCLVLIGLSVTFIFGLSDVFAQQGIVRIAKVTPAFRGDTILTGPPVRFVLRYTNNTSSRVNVSNGFKISAPDGAIWDSVTMELIGPKDYEGQTAFSRYFDFFVSGETQMKDLWPSGSDTVYFAGTGNLHDPHQLPVSFDDTVLAITVWANNEVSVNDGKHLCMDSSFYWPSGTWVWPGRDLVDYHPVFAGLGGQSYTPGLGYCFFFYNAPCFTGSCCCSRYGHGNVNQMGIVDLADLSALVSFLTGGGYLLPCTEAANINSSGIVDLSDLSALVSYLTGGGFVFPACLE